MLAYATMAQSVEHVLGKDGVTGSNPVSSSTKGTFNEVPFCRRSELYFQVQHPKKKEEVHISLRYNGSWNKFYTQGDLHELP